MIYNLAFWIRKNEANGKHYHDGRHWTYNSMEAFSRLFPFWTAKQVRRILSSLVEQGVIVTGNYNENRFDKTAWYAFSDNYIEDGNIVLPERAGGCAETGTSICPNGQMEMTERADDYTDKKTYINTDNKHSNVQRENSRRTTSEPLCLFSNSIFFDKDKFLEQFSAPEFADVDIEYYYQAVADWSSQGGKKKRDWIATARNFMRGDADKGRLHRKTSNGVVLDNNTMAYLQMMSEL